MKKLFSILIASFPAIVSAQTGQYDIKGKIGNADKSAKVYLYRRQGDSEQVDSTVVKNGSFEFKGSVSDPTVASLLLDQKGVGYNVLKAQRTKPDVLRMYIENGNMSLTVKDSIKNAVFSGSKINQDYSEYLKMSAVPQKAIEAVYVDYDAASSEKKKDPTFVNSLRSRLEDNSAQIKVIRDQYIKQHPNSYVSLDLLIENTGPYSLDASKYEPIFKGLSAEVRGTKKGLEFAKALEKARPVSIGAIAQDFTQNDVNGKPVSLSSFRGKYVLLDFWASWCGPCRAANPGVVKAYNKFKTKNFTVLGVSLDQEKKRDAWLSAIKSDGLVWTQVSDLKAWDNEVAKLYQVHAIPQNFLIDPKGKIIARDLSEEELEKKLQEVLGS